MYQSILVPLDGSELARGALFYAAEFAVRLGLRIYLLHVHGVNERESLALHQSYIDQEAEKLDHECRVLQQKLVDVREPLSGIQVTGTIRTGNPAEEILGFCEENRISLILMGTHGRSGIGRWAIGSVADKVLRAAKPPVLLIRAGVPAQSIFEAPPGRSVLVPLDGSELAESVLPHVQTLAATSGAERAPIVLLGVCEPPLLPGYYPPEIPYNWEDHIDGCKRGSLDYLQKVAVKLAGAGFDARVEVVVGSASEEIVNCANRRPFSLIVMATHGRSGISRWEIGRAHV